MKERERVLDLVKKGILSTEEALVLLENMATEKNETQLKRAADEAATPEAGKVSDELMEKLRAAEAEEQETAETPKDPESEDKERLEKILDNLATEANKASAELDEVNVEIKGLKIELTEKREGLMEFNTKEELDSLSEEDVADREKIEAEIKDLEASLADLEEQKNTLEEQLKSIRRERWEEQKETISSKFEIPEDWKDQATDTLNQVGEKMSEAGSQLGSFLKKTFSTFSEAVNDNMDWKDVNIKVPSVASTKFEHEFNYPAPQASLIDVKVANGNIVFKTWDQEDVKVEAKIKLYGKMPSETPMEAFLERSQIDVDDEVISFQIPNKRIRADLVFYLPARVYDHVSVKLLNGNITVETLEAKDVYTKSTNGNLVFQKLDATMLEVEGVNGEIKVMKGTLLDTMIETVNGNVTVTAAPQNLSVSLINGDVRVTLMNDNLRKVNATSVNGNVKIALPDEISLEGTAKTSLGSINSRLADYEVIREKKERTNQLLQFRRSGTDQVADIYVSTTTGSIYVKDAGK